MRLNDYSEEEKLEVDHDMILAFWFAIHLEEVEMTNTICKDDYMLKQFIACADVDNNVEDLADPPKGRRAHKLEDSQESHDFSDEDGPEDQFEGGEGESKNSLGRVLHDLKQQKAKTAKLDSMKKQRTKMLDDANIDESVIERTRINGKIHLTKVRNAFMERYENIMTNVLQIAIQRQEEKIACLITAHYEFILEDEMIFRAITNGNFEWLKFVWGFQKNYIGPKMQ